MRSLSTGMICRPHWCRLCSPQVGYIVWSRSHFRESEDCCFFCPSRTNTVFCPAKRTRDPSNSQNVQSHPPSHHVQAPRSRQTSPAAGGLRDAGKGAEEGWYHFDEQYFLYTDHILHPPFFFSSSSFPLSGSQCADQLDRTASPTSPTCAPASPTRRTPGTRATRSSPRPSSGA